MDFKGILIVCDLDNTVVVNDDITDVDAAAAMAFTMQGGLLSIATGRLRDSAKRFSDTLGVNCPVICQNGGYIFDFQNNQELSSVTLNNRACDITRDIIAQYPTVRVQVFSRQKIYFVGYPELPGGEARYKVMADSIDQIPKPWAKVLFYAPVNVLENLRITAKVLDTNGNFDFVNSAETFFEMLPKGVNKGKALVRLAELMNVPIEKTIAIGDNENDTEMLQAAGLGLAVHNAHPMLAEVADFVLPYECGTALFGTVRMLKNGDIKL